MYTHLSLLIPINHQLNDDWLDDWMMNCLSFEGTLTRLQTCASIPSLYSPLTDSGILIHKIETSFSATSSTLLCCLKKQWQVGSGNDNLLFLQLKLIFISAFSSLQLLRFSGTETWLLYPLPKLSLTCHKEQEGVYFWLSLKSYMLLD